MKPVRAETQQERDALQMAIQAANAKLAEAWPGEGPKWFVAYIELNSQIPVAGEMVISERQFLAGAAETPE